MVSNTASTLRGLPTVSSMTSGRAGLITSMRRRIGWAFARPRRIASGVAPSSRAAVAAMAALATWLTPISGSRRASSRPAPGFQPLHPAGAAQRELRNAVLAPRCLDLHGRARLAAARHPDDLLAKMAGAFAGQGAVGVDDQRRAGSRNSRKRILVSR
jgi:hypothetical protein